MQPENIILREVSQAQKAKGCMSSSYVEYRPNTNTNDYIYMETYTKRVSKRGTGRGDQERRKRRKER
jgi:predicted small secreted protein